MITFPDNIQEGIQKLRNKYRGKKHIVSACFPIIEIIKYLENREISIKLFFFADSNTLEVQAPDQHFYSKISYYDYRKTERRWIRNKDYLFSIIRDFKYCGLWEFITNKDFFIKIGRASCRERV